MGNILVNRYVRDFDWAANALNDEDNGRMKKLEGIVKKYGEQYEIAYARKTVPNPQHCMSVLRLGHHRTQASLPTPHHQQQ